MTTTMVDTIGADAHNIPVSTKKVAGYVTGTGAVPWSAADWGLFTKSGRVRIDQSPGAVDPTGSDVLDVENGASPPAAAVDWLKARIANDMKPGAIYGSGASLEAVEAAFLVYGTSWWTHHLYLWLADWNLNEAEATALLGQVKYGMEIAAVQWASPTSNPNTILPGSTLNLAAANCDLSVTLDTWMPPPSTPPPAPTVVQEGYLVSGFAGGTVAGRIVHSENDGASWE